jgi:hypothetical protein
MKKTLLGLAALSTLIFSTSSFAAVIYSDSTSFTTGLYTTVVDNYENAGYTFIQDNSSMSSVLGETDYQTTGFSDLNIVFGTGVGGNHMYCAGCNGSFLLDFTSTSVSGANGVYGVGFDYFNTTEPLYNAFVTYGDGSTENFALASAWGSALQFWGITSNLGISSIHLGLTDGIDTQEGSFAIDNLTIGKLPEPAGLLLLGLGLLGLVAARKRQAR